MKTTRIARKLGLDGNPLRRRTDKIAACLSVLLLAVFLIGAPFLSAAAAGWAGHHGDAELRATRSWHQVSAVLLRSAPAPRHCGFSAITRSWPGGPHRPGGPRTGRIPVSADMAAGRTVRLWVDSAGSPTGHPPNRRAVVADEVAAAVVATSGLGIVLLCLAWAGRWVLDRRRLAGWEAGWAAVGPQWTRRFRSRG